MMIRGLADDGRIHSAVDLPLIGDGEVNPWADRQAELRDQLCTPWVSAGRLKSRGARRGKLGGEGSQGPRQGGFAERMHPVTLEPWSPARSRAAAGRADATFHSRRRPPRYKAPTAHA